MKKTIAIMLMLAVGCMSLASCNGSGGEEAQNARNDGAAEIEGSADATEESVVIEDTEATVIEDPDYSYPYSIYSNDAPGSWFLHEGGFEIAVPAVYEDCGSAPEVAGRPALPDYYIYAPDEDTRIWFYAISDEWTEEKPSWMQSDSYNRSLEEVPEFMSPTLLELFSVPGDVNGGNPFTLDSTDLTVLSEETILTADMNVIRREMQAYGHSGGIENTIYFTVCYGHDHSPDGYGSADTAAFLVIAMSTDGSAEARQIMNDTVDYAVTYYYH